MAQLAQPFFDGTFLQTIKRTRENWRRKQRRKERQRKSAADGPERKSEIHSSFTSIMCDQTDAIPIGVTQTIV
jgi:hypothetical protein